MPSRQALSHIERTRLIAILRGDMRGSELDLVGALIAGGITAIEVSTVTPNYAAVIRNLEIHFADQAAIGAGTVLSLDELAAVHDAGASFIVSPNTDPTIIQQTRKLGLASYPGAYTATEVVAAMQAGANAVKIFPAVSLGPAYIRALLVPLPRVRLVPTGGIDLHNLADFLAAGAFAVGIGSELVGKPELETLNPAALQKKAAAYALAAQQAHA